MIPEIIRIQQLIFMCAARRVHLLKHMRIVFSQKVLNLALIKVSHWLPLNLVKQSMCVGWNGILGCLRLLLEKQLAKINILSLSAMVPVRWLVQICCGLV